ncbi:sensor histidine kinase [Qipengyuania sp. DGS5-3]|uniref:sensor histidine kinase n=1 Tax=Qipengyuania sp. DGS5-3 TaxID=3349632 RepID=UPI0036D433A0
MHFDDRLATVLRHRATGELAARTQYRQLLDLLGEKARFHDESLEAAAFLRLETLSQAVPTKDRARIVSESGQRIRNPALVAFLGEHEAEIAAPALARATLSASEWKQLIPALPIQARGFLRHRTTLPDEAVAILNQLGVQDRVLPNHYEPEELEASENQLPNAEAPKDTQHTDEKPELILDESLVQEVPEAVELQAPNEVQEAPAEINDEVETEPAPTSQKPGIGELVRRIEAFSKARDNQGGESETQRGENAPRLPLGEQAQARERKRTQAFGFSADSDYRIDWADTFVAPSIVGTRLTRDVRAVPALAQALRNRQPVTRAKAELEGAPVIAGDWLIDATPRFTQTDGRFAGYVGRFRRLSEVDNRQHAEAEADRIRQLLHELRTPVNAVQGFAEVIQQQLFGAASHEYRALAASIAGDSARMLSGFDELDRLARLEGGSLTLAEGSCDFRAITQQQVEHLQSMLSPRVARFDVKWHAPRAFIPIAEDEAELLAWRFLGTIASTTAAGEIVAMDLQCDAETLEYTCGVPSALKDAEDIFATEPRTHIEASTPGIFGSGFALRLARAEARACGGELARQDNHLVLSLPLLTSESLTPSPESAPDRAPS